MALFALSFAAVRGLTPPLRICTVSTCGRNGGQAFCEALQELTADSDQAVVPRGCMSRCRGIVVAGGHLKSTTSLDLKLDKDDALVTYQSAAAFLDEAGLNTKVVASALLSKLSGDDAARAGDYAAAVTHYSDVIEGPRASALRAELVAEGDGVEEDLPLPVFRLSGRAAQEEAERVTPRRVRWLYEALVSRCAARLALEEDDTLDDAMTDAQDATRLCALAGGGWYRLRDAAKAVGNRAAAARAERELTRLGYALDVEGPPPTDAERRAMEQAQARAAAQAETERLAAQQRAEKRARVAAEQAEALRAAEAAAAEAARIEAEYNTPEAIAARATEAAAAALRARLMEARKRQDAEKLLEAFKWSGGARRDGMLKCHMVLLNTLSAEAAEAAAAGATSEVLDEANKILVEMEATKQAMEAM